MKPVQDPLPFTPSGCVIEAVEGFDAVFIEGRGTKQQSWFMWSASCGGGPSELSRCSHPELAVGQGMRIHRCEVAA